VVFITDRKEYVVHDFCAINYALYIYSYPHKMVVCGILWYIIVIEWGKVVDNLYGFRRGLLA